MSEKLLPDCTYEIEVDDRVIVRCNYATDFDTAHASALRHARAHKATARLHFGGKSYDVEP
jgi:hypothetical protein